MCCRLSFWKEMWIFFDVGIRFCLLLIAYYIRIANVLSVTATLSCLIVLIVSVLFLFRIDTKVLLFLYNLTFDLLLSRDEFLFVTPYINRKIRSGWMFFFFFFNDIAELYLQIVCNGGYFNLWNITLGEILVSDQ